MTGLPAAFWFNLQGQWFWQIPDGPDNGPFDGFDEAAGDYRAHVQIAARANDNICSIVDLL